MSIGRGEDNTLVIHDGTVSRRHAVLELGEKITITDVGSANGTSLRDCRIEPNRRYEIALNELIGIGSLWFVIQPRFEPAQTGHFVTHEYFETRVAEECARAARTGAEFSLLRLHVEYSSNAARDIESLALMLRQSDVLAKVGPSDYMIMLVDTGREGAADVARRTIARLSELGTRATCTRSHYPTDGRSTYALMTQGAPAPCLASGDIVVEPSMCHVYDLVGKLATSDIPVLVLGETGVGKDKVAQSIHRLSPRANHPFVAINCAAIAENLLESELFGHEKGAFTGADSRHSGLFESAENGTVLLDEIGEMSPATQAKLLRVIEEGEVRRVGGVRGRKLKVRFIAATNRDLETATQQGRFRADLYYRLSAATVVIPPLRERRSEIEPLACKFAAEAATRATRAIPRISRDAIAVLTAYSWPGNIRELRNVIERAVLMCGSEITQQHIPVEKMRATFIATSIALPNRAPDGANDRALVIDALERAGGNQSVAASLLGVSRRTLINRLDYFQIPRPRKKRRKRSTESVGKESVDGGIAYSADRNSARSASSAGVKSKPRDSS